jgi:hypothetical protein
VVRGHLVMRDGAADRRRRSVAPLRFVETLAAIAPP